MRLAVAAAVAVAAVVSAAHAPTLVDPRADAAGRLGVTPMPLPFTRVLSVTTPAMTGDDVFILQNLIARSAGGAGLTASGVSNAATGAAGAAFQTASGMPATGNTDAPTATAVLAALSADKYVDSGIAPEKLGYLYKVYVPVYANRSIETNASLIAGNGTVLYTFVARAHGSDVLPSPPWPYFNNCCPGLNPFTSDGDTPTGLIEFDLNSPEDNSTEFGPYPVNRAVQGIEGNAAWLIPNIRNGILLHTGEWQKAAPWYPGLPMPNSLGCIHAYPESIYTIWQILVNQLGVKVRPNTDGALPYPYKCQGLLSIEQID